ncbi:MAG: ATP-dependent helicase, partial [Rhodocyclales bacterium]|nr:ATP-dependent helicase [Rhodocyclales bacterium]
ALQLLAGVGPKTAGRILDNVASAAPGAALLAEQPVPEGARAAWAEFSALVEMVGQSGANWPAPFEKVGQWYIVQLERLHEDAAIRQGDIVQLAQIAATYPSRERFLTELTLDPPEATSDQSGIPALDEDYLILSTIHSAKGQEWTAVSILNAVDGCIPSDLATGSAEEIEEERRLLYVAMTRARDTLDIVTPQRFYVTQQGGLGDRHLYGSRTRFIGNAMLPCFEQLAWPVPPEGQRGSPESKQAAVDLAQRMRDMWR